MIVANNFIAFVRVRRCARHNFVIHTYTFIKEWQHKHAGFKTKHYAQPVPLVILNLKGLNGNKPISNSISEPVAIEWQSVEMARYY